MTTFEWKLGPIAVNLSVDGKTDVISKVVWYCNARDGNEFVSSTGNVSITYDPLQPFIPFEDILEEEALAWVYSTIDKTAVEADLIAKITEKITESNTKKVKPAPWLKKNNIRNYWDVQALPSGFSAVGGLAFGNNVFCVVDSVVYGRFATSTDGKTWVTSDDLLTKGWVFKPDVIFWTGTMFFLANYAQGKTATSLDGKTWTIGSNTLGRILTSIIWDGTMAYAFSAATSQLLTSADCLTWTIQTGLPSLTASERITYAYPSNNGIVAVGFNNKIYRSSNKGATWSISDSLLSTPLASAKILSIAEFNNCLYATSSVAGQYATSTDGGDTWKHCTNLPVMTPPVNLMTTGPKVFALSLNKINVSSDFLTWKDNTPKNLTGRVKGFTIGNNLLVIGCDNMIATSKI